MLTVTTALKRRRAAFATSGFSLVEMAIVLLILGILLSGLMVAISQTALSAQRSATLAQLRQVEDALYGFVQSQGRLPCPAFNTTAGYEGVCNGGEGFVPHATLGLYGAVNADGILVDAWQNPLRYAVVFVGNPLQNPDFSIKTSIQDFFNAGTAMTGSTFTITICKGATGSGCATGDVITDTAAAIVFSTGANGAAYTSASEAENYARDDMMYVSTTYNETQFDDQLVWLSPYVVFSRMVSAGKLP